MDIDEINKRLVYININLCIITAVLIIISWFMGGN